jgi:chromosome segregation ATPase
LNARRLLVAVPEEQPAPEARDWREPAAALAASVATLAEQLAAAQAELAAARAERAALERRVEELRTWLEDARQFDFVEHVQLERLLALQAAERERRLLARRPSLGLVAVLTYAAAALALAWLIVADRI